MASKAFSYLSSSELTDIGLRRKNNEDAVLRLPDSGVFCVADGMGGVQGGEVASKATVDALQDEFTKSPDAPFALTAASSARLIERAINSASRWIKARADGLGLVGTGSTVVVLGFDRVMPARAVVLHAGDSRVYRYRSEKLVQLTTDHSVAAAAGLQDDNTLPAMFRGVITRAVGLDKRVRLEETDVDVMPGDVFLLCSDGLSKMLSDKQIHKLLRQHQADDEGTLANALVAAALKEGGGDNVSVVLVRVAKELPQGPTMELPPQTVVLEQLTLGEEAPPVSAPAEEEHDKTGETAESAVNTSKTAAENTTPSDGANKVDSTPVTPVSNHANGSVTPVTPARTLSAIPGGASSPGRKAFQWLPGGAKTLWGLLVVVVVGGIWWLVKWREAKDAAESQAAPVSLQHSEPAQAAPPPQTSAAPIEANAAGARQGVQE